MKKITPKQIRDNLAGWAFILPVFLFIFSFMIYPIVHTFVLCFQKYNFVFDDKPVFVGLSNFIEIFQMRHFQQAILNTLYFAGVYIPVVMILGFIVGYILANERLFSARTAKVILFIPMVIPVSMSCFMFLFMLDPQIGLINGVLRDYLGLGFLTRDWMNNPGTALNMIAAVTMWQQIGLIGLLFMAGIQAIPQSTLEAAVIDGATARQRIFYVIVPSLKPTFQVVGILAIITSIKLFAQVIAMTGAGGARNAGGPANRTLTMYVDTWKAAFQNFDMGIASAMGYVMVFIIMVLFGINTWLTKTERA